MQVRVFSTLSAVLVLTAFSASAQDYNNTDDRFKPRIYGSTSVAGVIYSEGANAHLDQAGVVRTQHIRQSDVSPEEYNRLLQEAERVKAYKNRLRSAQTQPVERTQLSDPNYQVQQQQPYEIQLFESAPVQAAQPDYASYATQSSNYSAGQYHTVVKNDTLYSLSKRFGVEIDVIRSTNNIIGNNISLGQQIIIPSVSSAYSQNVNAVPSQAMDEYATISQQYGRTINRVVRPVTTDVGAQTNSIYAVLPKDTLYSISRQTCIGVTDLIAMNGLSDPNALKPGQRLNVPAGNCLPR